jgi:2-(1,2-epoxy-1,2-dihydrophenyl)acetyl-CoA isomerase
MHTLSMTVADGVATIQRGANDDAIALHVVRDMHTALDRIQKRGSGARAVVLTVNDLKLSGCMHLNPSDMKTKQQAQRWHMQMRGFMNALIVRLSEFRYPIIAAINGITAGPAMSLALASDIIVAGTGASFLPSSSRLGLVPDAGITFHLARRVGGGRSIALLMLAEEIDAAAALKWGLVYDVVSDTEVLTRAQLIGRRLAAGPTAVLGQIRALHVSSYGNSLAKQLRSERAAQEIALGARTFVEGASAFFEKREPVFLDDQ